jgi:MFS family permease
LLGACEAGFIPGTLYYLSRWYRKSQYATRNTIFFLGNQFGTACSGAIGSGILTLAGKHGIAGWRWLFLINGVMTIFIGILWLFFLPESPKKCSPLLFPNLKYLDSDSSEIIHNSVLKDDGEKIKNNVRITAKDIINVFSDWRIWQHVLVTFIPMSASTCSVYFPSIVKALGYTEIDANAMSSVGYFIAMPFQFALAYFSDVTKRRGVAVIIPQILASIFLGLVYGMSTAKSKYTAIVFLQMTLYSYHVLNVTWTSSNCIFPAQRSLALAAVVMSANFSQLAGAPIFGAKYAPTFNTSFIVCIVLSCIGTVFSISVAAGYAFSNQKINKQSPATTEQPKDQIVQEVVNLSPGYISRQRRERRLLYVF